MWLCFYRKQSSFYHKGAKGYTKAQKGVTNMHDPEKIIKIILDAAFTVHSQLGPGLLEGTYERCLEYELQARNISVERQKVLPVEYKEVQLSVGYRIDLLVAGQIIIELKSVEAICDLHVSQILTYMKLSRCKYGLLINFNVQHLKNGIRRMIL